MKPRCPASLLGRALPLALAAILAAPLPAHAVDWTDIWFNPAESGWGVNIVQAEDFLFVTFFVYGADRKPTWYTAQLTRDSTGSYNGGLYLTQGSYFIQRWNPAEHPAAQAVGTATFTPGTTNAYQGTLSYTVAGLDTVTTAIERQTLKTTALGGAYVGGQTHTYAGCGTFDGTYPAAYELAVTQTTSGQVAFAFRYFDADRTTCTLSGKLEQHGQLYSVPNASYVCTGGNQFTAVANMSEVKQTAQGIEGRWKATLPLGNCTESARFSASF